MPELKNARHEKFCQGIAKGKSATDAYIDAGYDTKDRPSAGRYAYRLRKTDRIQDRIAELTGKKARRVALDQVAEAIGQGRPTTYRPELADLGRRLALLGLDDQGMAEAFNVDAHTIQEWRLKYPDFRRAIDRGGVLADAKVAEKLYHRALGARVPATKIMQHEGQVITHDYVEHYPPDTNAARLWLTNRQRGRWKHRETVEQERTPEDLLREQVMAMSREERLAWMMDVAERARLMIEAQGRTIEHRDDEIPE